MVIILERMSETDIEKYWLLPALLWEVPIFKCWLWNQLEKLFNFIGSHFPQVHDLLEFNHSELKSFVNEDSNIHCIYFYMYYVYNFYLITFNKCQLVPINSNINNEIIMKQDFSQLNFKLWPCWLFADTTYK